MGEREKKKERRNREGLAWLTARLSTSIRPYLFPLLICSFICGREKEALYYILFARDSWSKILRISLMEPFPLKEFQEKVAAKNEGWQQSHFRSLAERGDRSFLT